ncbi:alpha/beta hydrolase [Mycobacteroides chelonae]|uniref:alpha/beta hydrolase n=1 Tax=Mycobacteroides chelonae TaxID=1774 RepID=UPI003AAAF825
MTHSTDLPAGLPQQWVTAEVPRRASLRLRMLGAALYATARQFMELAVWIDEHQLVPTQALVFVCRFADPVLYPLRPRRGTQLRRVTFPNFRAEWVWDKETADPGASQESAILYLHGGGLIACGLNSHRRHVARIARESGAALLNVDYRQIPQAHVTETLEDCLEAYVYLLAQGFPAERIVIAGDSAGGGLAFSLALALRDRGLPMPGGIAALAPWADYDSAARIAHQNDRTDALLPARAYALPVKWGMEIEGVLDPAWSAVNHQMAGLPPVLIQVASTEVLRVDAEQLAQRCAEAGVPVTLQIWDNAFHVFQVAADVIPDARQAVADIAAFIRDRIGVSRAVDPSMRTSA